MHPILVLRILQALDLNRAKNLCPPIVSNFMRIWQTYTTNNTISHIKFGMLMNLELMPLEMELIGSLHQERVEMCILSLPMRGRG